MQQMEIHPRMEILRGDAIELLCVKIADVIAQAFNKPVKMELVNMIVSRFCWKNTNKQFDAVLPYNDAGAYNVTQFVTDIRNLFKINNILNIMNMQEILIDVQNNFQNIVRSTKFEFNSELEMEVDMEFVDKKEFIRLMYDHKRYSVLCPRNIYYKLEQKYTGPAMFKLSYIFSLLYRYECFGADNFQYATNPDIKDKICQVMNINHELFGSAINHTCSYYNSLYYDIEKYFGSCGVFGQIPIVEGCYFAKPPFDEEIMSNMTKTMIDSLNRTEASKSKGLVFVVVLPVWDPETQRKFQKLNGITPYGSKFEALDMMKSSPYYYGSWTFVKEDFTFVDNFTEKNIILDNVHVVVLKSKKINNDRMSCLDVVLGNAKGYKNMINM